MRQAWRAVTVLAGIVLLNLLTIVLLLALPSPNVVAEPVPDRATRPPVSTRPVFTPNEERGILISADGRTFYRFPRRPGDTRPEFPRRPEGDPTVTETRTGGVTPIIANQRPTTGPPGARPDDGRTITDVRRPLPETQTTTNRPLVVVVHPFGIVPPGPTGAAHYLASLVAFTGSALALMLFAPGRIIQVRNAITGQPLRLLRLGAIGALGYVIAGVLAALLVIVLVGIPLAAVLALFVSIAAFTGILAIALATGARLAGIARLQKRGPLIDLVLGMLVLLPLSMLPIAGWAIIGGAASVGFGAIILTRFGTQG